MGSIPTKVRPVALELFSEEAKKASKRNPIRARGHRRAQGAPAKMMSSNSVSLGVLREPIERETPERTGLTGEMFRHERRAADLGRRALEQRARIPTFSVVETPSTEKATGECREKMRRSEQEDVKLKAA